jgi:small subunit ribosomal protein S17
MNKRRRLIGIVTSNRMQKTVVVQVSRTYQHPLYHKVVHASSRMKAHDELNCQIGDKVQIVESRPLSREKHWVVETILKHEGAVLKVAEVEAEPVIKADTVTETETETETGEEQK